LLKKEARAEYYINIFFMKPHKCRRRQEKRATATYDDALEGERKIKGSTDGNPQLVYDSILPIFGKKDAYCSANVSNTPRRQPSSDSEMVTAHPQLGR
jgi:hypothetical protein